MRDSPRIRRLKNDHKALQKLRDASTIVDFDASGEPTDKYLVRFRGRGLWRPNNTSNVQLREMHEVRVVLGASYPRMMPELSWVTPIFHPNISASGVVCLGGYGTHWVPSLSLDELCEMLWDMIRYQNFDTESPYNREAALWAKSQNTFSLPVDCRPIRDRIASEAMEGDSGQSPSAGGGDEATPMPEVVIIDDAADEIIDAELVDSTNAALRRDQDQDQDIVFLD